MNGSSPRVSKSERQWFFRSKSVVDLPVEGKRRAAQEGVKKGEFFKNVPAYFRFLNFRLLLSGKLLSEKKNDGPTLTRPE